YPGRYWRGFWLKNAASSAPNSAPKRDPPRRAAPRFESATPARGLRKRTRNTSRQAVRIMLGRPGKTIGELLFILLRSTQGRQRRGPVFPSPEYRGRRFSFRFSVFGFRFSDWTENRK